MSLPTTVRLRCLILNAWRRLSLVLVAMTLTCSENANEPPPWLLASPRDYALEAAEVQAQALWHSVGIYPPTVRIVRGNGPTGSAGFCYCFGATHPLIVVRFPGVTLIAHELGHAMGLWHVPLDDTHELMAATVYPDSYIGPETLAEWRRVRAALRP